MTGKSGGKPVEETVIAAEEMYERYDRRENPYAFRRYPPSVAHTRAYTHTHTHTHTLNNVQHYVARPPTPHTQLRSTRPEISHSS